MVVDKDIKNNRAFPNTSCNNNQVRTTRKFPEPPNPLQKLNNSGSQAEEKTT
jgi:hypothetical protein